MASRPPLLLLLALTLAALRWWWSANLEQPAGAAGPAGAPSDPELRTPAELTDLSDRERTGDGASAAERVPQPAVEERSSAARAAPDDQLTRLVGRLVLPDGAYHIGRAPERFGFRPQDGVAFEWTGGEPSPAELTLPDE